MAGEAAAVNTAAVALMTAFEAYCDTLATNDQICVAWIASKTGDQAGNSEYGPDATNPDSGILYFTTYNPNVTDKFPFEIGGKPLFFFLMNPATGAIYS